MPLKFIKNFMLIVCLQYASNLYAQRIDHTASFRSIHQKNYFRFHYDNDFFTKTDRYYSQGITVEYANPGLRRNPLSPLLIKLPGSFNQYSISFNIFGYTPTSIHSDSILFGDRPYFSALSLGSHLISMDAARKQRMVSSIYFGIFGPAALGKEIQSNIHRWLGNPQPHGWQYQVRNDIILNYEIMYEKQLIDSHGHFLLNGVAELRTGTLNDKAAAGFNFMAGNFIGPFQKDNNKKVEYYFYGQAKGSLVGYDASMQGGIFNQKSPYTITAGNINRFTFQADAGVIVNFKRIYLSYTQSFLTKEFSTGKYHRWGGFSMGCSF